MILPVKMMFMTRSELFELVLKFWKFLRVKTQLATFHLLSLGGRIDERRVGHAGVPARLVGERERRGVEIEIGERGHPWKGSSGLAD